MPDYMSNTTSFSTFADVEHIVSKEALKLHRIANEDLTV